MSGPANPINPRSARGLLLICFFFSGFTALLYQTVWMRLALAKFGVNTSVVATVLAVFMLGLATGSVLAARLVERAQARFGIGPLRIYALAELIVGVGGLAVPALLSAGRGALLAVGPASGGLYTAGSTALLTAILLPFCTAMGLTFPSAIAFLRRAGAAGEGREPFSALYLANVLGALAGAVTTPLFFIELYGFLATCRGAALLNVAIAAAAFAAFPRGLLAPAEATRPVAASALRDPASRARRLALFVTGFSTMGMEVVWMRIYPTVLGTFVYSFAAIVAIYLVATTLGSTLYRLLRRRPFAGRMGVWFPWLCAASLLPLLSASVTFPEINGILRVSIGLVPFCALLGFLTPALVDREAGDDAAAVGRAYGINLLGCLLGPLVAGFVLLPMIGTRATAVVLALPLFLVLITPAVRRDGHAVWSLAALATAAGVLFATTLFEEAFPKAQVRRDHVATVVALGTGKDKLLYVNGVGMTVLTTVTKMMAHFPAAHLARRDGRPFDALVICFGMGTSFRSLASWGANVTAVELVPSVPELFGYYFPEGPELVRASSGRLRIVCDDGRRFLDRSHDTFDLITIDPPPPVEAAGSGMLYSKEFYASAKRKMKPGAILETWLPGGDRETVAGMALSVLESFPYVRVLGSIEGNGFHVMASNDPLPRLIPAELVARMPEAAVSDMREWVDAPPTKFFEFMLANEYLPESLLIDHSRVATLAISDDRPVNEFYFMRRWSAIDVAQPTSGGKGPPAAAVPQ
jgi:spermidine synthase